jgi:hypothetical protein
MNLKLFLVPILIQLSTEMLTNGTLPKIRRLSSSFSDPNGSFGGMRDSLKARVRLQRKIISRNFLAKLHKKKVGTGEIEAAAKRVIYGEDAWNAVRNKHVEKEVVWILRLRIKTADRKIKELECEWRNANSVRLAMFDEEAWRWCSRGMDNPSRWMEKSYCEIENSEMRTQWEDGKNWTVRRADWLDDKYGMKRKQFDKTLLNAGVKYTDDDLDDYDRKENLENGPGFVVYGDVVITDEEKEYLNLTPKFREHEKLNVQKWHTEVEVNAIKTRWELMGQDKENRDNEGKTIDQINEENKRNWESKQIYKRETGDLTMSNLKATNIPTVTRLFPPRPAGGKNEMIIQEQINLAKEAFEEYNAEKCDDRGKLTFLQENWKGRKD